MEMKVEIGGRSVTLRYTVNSMCAVEDMAGGALDSVMEKQFTAARLLLWGGMLDGCPDLTPADAGRIIGDHLAAGGTLEEIVEFCAEGLRRAGFFGQTAQQE